MAFHALESMWYQIGWLVILAVGWTLTGLLTMILIGFLLIPVMAVVSVVPFVHAAYAAYKVSRDDGYRYPIAADLVEGANLRNSSGVGAEVPVLVNRNLCV